MYQYYLFDLDGTLTDPKIGITSSVQYALRDFGIEEENLDKLEPFIGPPLIDSFMEFYGMTRSEAEKAVVKYRERFSVKGKYENEIYDGIPELLKCLKEAGKRLAIASSKPTVFVKDILEYFHIQQYFDVIVGGEMAKKSKPEPDIYLEACKRMGITPESAYGVEDSYNGMRSLHAAGLHPIMVPDLLEANEEMQSLAEVILPDLIEVRDYLKNVWNNR